MSTCYNTTDTIRPLNILNMKKFPSDINWPNSANSITSDNNITDTAPDERITLMTLIMD